MDKITPGKYVELGYDLYEVNADGSQELRHQTDREDPERLIFGVTRGVIPAFEKALDGLSVGDKFDLVVKGEEAFGPHDPEQVAELDRDIFMIDGKFDADTVKPGAVLGMMTADGYRINGLVVEVTDKKVKMDFNHPLAGKDVRFVGEVYAVREATPEELAPSHGCCGCHHEGGDDCHCSGDKECGDHQCGCN